MTDTPDCPDHQPLDPAETQYSLRTAFIATTGFALTFSGIFAGPTWVSWVTVITFTTLTTIALTIVLIHGRSYQRTFCVGALFPAGLMTYQSLGILVAAILYGASPFYSVRMNGGPTSLEAAIFLMVYCLIVIVAGAFAVGVRWMVESSRRS